MKKLLAILALSLLWCNAVLALDFPGLKNTKRFHLVVNDVSELGQQKCKIKKEEIEETIKKLITSHSKIEYVDLHSLPEEDWLSIEIINITPTITGNEEICIGFISFDTSSLGEVENSAGIKYIARKLSYYGGGGMAADYINNFKKTFFVFFSRSAWALCISWDSC